MKTNRQKLVIIVLLASFGLINSVNSQSISGGIGYSLFLCTDGTVRSCGKNLDGQLGDGTSTSKSTVVQVAAVSGIKKIEAGTTHSFFLKNDGTLWAVGKNDYKQLGDATTTNTTTPIQVPISGVIATAAYGLNSLFLKSDGTVWGAGSNSYGALGLNNNTSPYNPTAMYGVSGMIAIAEGNNFSLLLRNDGFVFSCGDNGYGQLGIGNTTNQKSLSYVNTPTGIIAIACGDGHSLFLKNDGTVWACGNNFEGQLGDGTTTSWLDPVKINSLSGIVAISAGYRHSLFLKNDGTVWACGDNDYGQLGIGTKDNLYHTTPVKVSTITGVKSISAGDYHSLFLKNDGTVWITGSNNYGQLGNGTVSGEAVVATQIPGLCTVIGIEEKSIADDISVYPNPCNGIFSVKSELGNFNIEIINVLGENIYSAQIIANESRIDLSNQPKGIYFYRMIGDTQILKTGKIIVK